MARGVEAKRGKVREYDGQRFECVRIEPLRRDGVMSSVGGLAFEMRGVRHVVRFQVSATRCLLPRPGDDQADPQAMMKLHTDLRIAVNALGNRPPDYHRHNGHMSPE